MTKAHSFDQLLEIETSFGLGETPVPEGKEGGREGGKGFDFEFGVSGARPFRNETAER